MLIHIREQEAFYFLKSEWRNQDREVRKKKNKQEDLKKKTDWKKNDFRIYGKDGKEEQTHAETQVSSDGPKQEIGEDRPVSGLIIFKGSICLLM